MNQTGNESNLGGYICGPHLIFLPFLVIHRSACQVFSPESVVQIACIRTIRGLKYWYFNRPLICNLPRLLQVYSLYFIFIIYPWFASTYWSLNSCYLCHQISSSLMFIFWILRLMWMEFCLKLLNQRNLKVGFLIFFFKKSLFIDITKVGFSICFF